MIDAAQKKQVFSVCNERDSPGGKGKWSGAPFFLFPAGAFMFRCDFLKRTHFLESGIGFRV